MSVHDVSVAVTYTLRTVDKGVRQAVVASQNLTRETRSSQKELDAALRANSAAWKDTARVAASAQRQVTEAAARASSEVDKSLVKEVASLRKAGVGYKEISAAARGWGASAEQAAAAVKRSADEEIRQIDRVAAARNKLRSMVGLSAPAARTAGGGRGRSTGEAEASGLERGAIRAGAGHLRSGVSFLGAGLVGGLAGYASVQGAKQAVDSTKELALETRTLSAVTGMDSKTASEWVAVTQARDIKTRTFAMTLKTLSTQTEGATSGSKKSVQAFKDLGITTDQLKSHSGDLSSLLGLVADHLDKMPGGAQKTAIASQLLGRNWSALQPILLEGSKRMADQRKEAAALGVTLGGNAAENAKKLEEASINLKIAQMGLQIQFAEHVAPAMIKVTEEGIKLFGILRRDLGPSMHFVAGEVKDASHWLEEHKTVLHAVEIALGVAAGGYATLKVAAGGIRFIRGLSADFVATKNAVTGLAHPIQALKGLFGQQETESQALMRSQTALAEANERLAKSFDQVAASSKGAGGGELAGEESGLVGGAPILGRGKGALGEEKALAGEPGLAGAGGKGITAAEKLGTAAETEIAQTGMWGMLLGRQGEQTLTSRLASLGSGLMKGAGVGFAGLLGSQLIGGAIGGKAGKTVTSLGTAASIGAGAGMVLGIPGAIAGAGIGAGTAELQHLFGGGDNADAVKKLQAQMVDASKRDDWKKLQQLADNATSASRGLQALGKNTTGQDLKKLGSAAQKTASSLQLQSAGRAVTGIESSIAGSKFAPSVSQITKATTSQLASLGPQAQRAGAAAIVKFTAGLESQKRLPVGSTDKLIRQLEAEYGPAFASTLQKSGTQSMKAFENTVAQSKVVSKVQDQVDQMHKQWGLLVPDVKVTSSNIEQVMTSNIEAMRNKVLNTTGQEQQDAIGHLNALLGLYAKYSPLIAAAGAASFTAMSKDVSGTLRTLGNTIGGSLGGWATMIADFAQAVTPALSQLAGAVSSGQFETPAGAQAALGGLVQAGGKTLLNLLNPKPHKHEGGYFHGVVPGDHTRDGTLAWLSGREFVMTGDGQQMMDSYAPGLLDHIAASQAPHFAAGGAVGGSVWNVRASAEESSSGIGWTELSTNGNAAAVSGHPHTATHSGGWDFSTLGRMYPKGTKLRIASGARSGIFPLTDYGDGSSFAPAIGLTPAVQSALGGMPSTVDISLADGASIALASGFGRLVSGSVSAAGSAKKGRGVSASLQPNTKTTYKPAGPGLGDGYYQGYEYGLDPTTGVGGPAALKAATLGSQLKAVTTSVPSPVKFTLPTIAGGKIPKSLQGNKRALGVDQAMMKAASQIIGLPYGSDHVGGHGAWNHGSYDCSGAVGYLLHAAGLTDSFQWTGSLASWGLPGDGKYVTVGLRDPQSQDNGHTMINFFGKYLESGGGGPLGKPSVHWDSGWDGNFPYHRHPPGLRRGGRIPRFAKGGPVGAKPKLLGSTPPLTAGQIKDQNSARALMGRIWKSAQPFYPGPGGKMPRTLLAGEWEPFVGDAWSPNDTKIKDRQIIWPQWMTSMLLGKPDQGNAGGRGAVNNALETLVHEWTHQYQSPHLLSTGQVWQIEGGADSFAREFAPRIIAGAGIKGYSSPGMGLYDGYVNRVRKQYGEQWIRRGQFTDATRKYRAGGRIPRFAKGGPVGGHSTGRPWPSNRNEADSKRATFMAPQHGTVDDRWRHRRRYARGGYVGAGAAGTFLPPQPVLPPSLTYQPVMSITQPVAPPAGSFYGTHTAAGVPRVLRRETTAISSAGTNQEAAHALTQLSKTVDNVKKVAYTSLLSEAKELQKAAASATKAGDKQQATRLKQAYQLVTNEAGRRVGALVKAATDEGAALTTANQRLQNMLTRNQIDPASAQGTAFIAKFQDQSVKVIKDEVSKLQKAYELAKKAGNQRATADAGSKLQQALSDLDDATATAVQDHVDQVNAAKQAVADAAQSTVDTATHDVTMASSGETALEDRQQLAGTSGTAAGAQQLSDYINQSVVPSMQKQVAALQAQEGVAQQQGNTTLAQQIAEQISDAQNGILQSQLDAQQAIQAATQATAENTQQVVGNLGVSYNNGSYADIAGALNGV